MKFTPGALEGVWIIDLEPKRDERGFLARTYCAGEFAHHGLNTSWPQCNLTLTKHAGSVRGMHWQANPKPEIKLIRCTAGAVFDVALDVRPDSPTFGQWEFVELSHDSGRMIYIPHGCAHGFQTRTDNAELFYQMSESYVGELARGVLWNDPAAAIRWPLPLTDISPRDEALPALNSLR